jgi:protein kinase-like protein
MDTPDSDADLTVGPAGAVTPSASPAGATASRGGRFAPGSIIAGRYRLVALLGRGGMGEVYRADDLTLDQPVALKFLPPGASDAVHLAQFHNELRVARQVSHKNVCRLYDVGEAEGRRFLTMEYVDGEDLASLLRRIGRIPQDKATEIARQLCAGVAAAHERGVLHRDLKPANVMLDGDGNVRITDFGIATAAADAGGAIAGTPQYMAPELFGGAAASARSDLFALGLILFEVFTGRRAYDAKTLADLKSLHDTGTLTTPSMIVHDLDPAIERVILRCLAKDPDQRPASALAVAAALPGGDPVAAALAAGETPSPAMLAAAAETDAVGVAHGLAAVVFVVAGLALVAALAPRVTIAGRVPMEKAPPVLVDRAQQILRSFGYTDPIVDSAYGFALVQPYLQWLAANDRTPRRWDALNSGSPAAVAFWYRTSPRSLVPLRAQGMIAANTDPPMTVSGMTYLILDTQGRAIEFQAVPPQIDPESPPAAPPWSALFAAAGLDMAAFTPVPPRWSPRDFADARAAWDGPLAGRPDIRVRVEAAAYRGQPTSMFVLGPWARPTRMAPAARTLSQTIFGVFGSLLIVALMLAALVIARRNVRLQRANRGGAARIVAFVLTGYAATWVLSAHHVPDLQVEISAFTRYFGNVLMAACILLVIYLALEPYVRRFWPDGILGWTRLTSGYVRDPRVGRDVLIGCAVAVGIAALEVLYNYLPPLFGIRPPTPTMQSNVGALAGASITATLLFDTMIGGLFTAMFSVLAYVLLRLTLRRTALAIAAAVALLSLLQLQSVVNSTGSPWLALAFQVVVVAVVVTMIVRYGLLVSVVAASVGNLLENFPLTLALSHWTATTSILTLATVLGLTCFGYYAARGGQPLFGDWDEQA